MSALGALSCAVATAGLVIPADAAVSDPHTVFVLKNDSIVEVEGLDPNENVLVQVRRNGVVVGSVEGPADPGGAFIINHDFCWDNFTPEILPGDVVRVTTAAGVDTVPVTDIAVVDGPARVGDTFTITGTVNPRVPVGQLQVEARTNDPIRFRPLAPDVVDGVRGTVSYDNATGGAFTARFTGMNAQQQQAADNLGEFHVAHVAATSGAGDPKEVTMGTEGSPVPGPGCSLDAPVRRHAVTNVTPGVINRSNRSRDVVVTGMTIDATEVTVRLRDRDGTVVRRNATVRGASGNQTWRATFAPRAMRRLNGNIRAVGTYTSGGRALSGATMSVLKDLVRPARPKASPDGGRYRRRQAVSLNARAGAKQIRYTLGNGRQRAPRRNTGLVYRGRQIRITSSQVLKAITVDRAGNVSEVTRERYRIR
ncbi:MAG: chitobiase/beta-hexosaminidase C-terminal domain-containing protein [Nocardioidaceae bacterium]